MWTKDSLLDLIYSKLGDYKFILVSNRPEAEARILGDIGHGEGFGCAASGR